MATIEQLEAKLRPYKIAVIEAFRLDPEAVPMDGITVGLGGITITEYRPNKSLIEHEFAGAEATDAQREAVNAYLQQFPRGSAQWPVLPHPV